MPRLPNDQGLLPEQRSAKIAFVPTAARDGGHALRGHAISGVYMFEAIQPFVGSDNTRLSAALHAGQLDIMHGVRIGDRWLFGCFSTKHTENQYLSGVQISNTQSVLLTLRVPVAFINLFKTK
jgi:hypothetical protein